MPAQFCVSTPSRLCLFGEHQDYLGLEVVAVAINLRFFATVKRRNDQLIHIKIRDRRLDRLDSKNDGSMYETVLINLDQPIVYTSNRDYLRSSIWVLQKQGYPLIGLDIRLDSEIPIGKGMCSSSTMIVVFMKALLTSIDHPDQHDPRRIAELAFCAEVLEFNEPGGRMDHYTSALGGLVHLDFGDDFYIEQLQVHLPGCFILFDSLEQKDTTRVLAESKHPTQEALKQLMDYGISSVRDFFSGDTLLPESLALLDHLDAFHRKKLLANIENYRILKEGLTILTQDPIDPETFGRLLSLHHAQLRDGLGISTPAIEFILDAALKAGALGGKVNGSGGGGCCFVYAQKEKADQIMDAVRALGYPARLLKQDEGVKLCNEPDWL